MKDISNIALDAGGQGFILGTFILRQACLAGLPGILQGHVQILKDSFGRCGEGDPQQLFLRLYILQIFQQDQLLGC